MSPAPEGTSTVSQNVPSGLTVPIDLCRIGKSLFYMRKDFNNLCHVSVEEWHKMKIYVFVSLNVKRKRLSCILAEKFSSQTNVRAVRARLCSCSTCKKYNLRGLSSALTLLSWRLVIKDLIDTACLEPIQEDSPTLQNFCVIMEHVLSHRLKRKYRQVSNIRRTLVGN